MLRHCLLIVFFYISTTSAHSWMSCPSSFNTNRGRGGSLSAPCEGWYLGANNVVNAGDRVKVGWTSNNHAGGFVRISLIKAPSTSFNNFFGASEAAFKQNVIKFACYGMDTREKRTKFGDCIHPCNARPGCQYQSDVDDVERFDTTITIPTNLKDGIYILQSAMLVGNGKSPYFSCAKFFISGGNPTLQCTSSGHAPHYKCHRSGGPSLDNLRAGTKKGDFCYHSDRRGEVDDRINETPVNLDCDPRIYCGLSVNKDICFQEDGMAYLQTAVGDPKQPDCGSNVRKATCSDGIKNQGEGGIDCGGPCVTKCLSCTDGIRNQGEDDVDCGGPCAPCQTCFDRIKNQKETGIDCGGPCKACPGCTDGIKNQGEDDIDCGGPCAACATCSDGIQNQGEGGVDCGGPCCNTCVPTCNDQTQNQGEEGVDCGGPCKACVKVETDDYVDIKHLEKDYGSGPIYITIFMKFLKDVPGKWKLRVEYNQKIKVLSTCGAAKMVDQNDIGNIYTFESNTWLKPPKVNDTRRIFVLATKTTENDLQPSGEFFEVGEVTELGKRSMYKGAFIKKCGERICDDNEACIQEAKLPCRKYPCKVTYQCVKEAPVRTDWEVMLTKTP